MRYLCAKLPQHGQGLKVQEVGPLDLTLFLRVQCSELGQDFLLLFVGQVFVELLLGHEVTILQQLVRHQARLYRRRRTRSEPDAVMYSPSVTCRTISQSTSFTMILCPKSFVYSLLVT